MLRAGRGVGLLGGNKGWMRLFSWLALGVSSSVSSRASSLLSVSSLALRGGEGVRIAGAE